MCAYQFGSYISKRAEERGSQEVYGGNKRNGCHKKIANGTTGSI